MHYEEIDGVYHVFVEVERSEDERGVLRNIVKASYELAPRYREYKNADRLMTNEIADFFVEMSDKPGDLVVEMICVRGRQCFTYVYREGPGHFRLENTYAGSLKQMLEKVQTMSWVDEMMD